MFSILLEQPISLSHSRSSRCPFSSTAIAWPLARFRGLEVACLVMDPLTSIFPQMTKVPTLAPPQT